jgi:hypothetical protein
VSAGKEARAEASDVEARLAAADYIADLSGDLAAIARMHGLETLSYVLEIAELEARSCRAAPA